MVVFFDKGFSLVLCWRITLVVVGSIASFCKEWGMIDCLLILHSFCFKLFSSFIAGEINAYELIISLRREEEMSFFCH